MTFQGIDRSDMMQMTASWVPQISETVSRLQSLIRTTEKRFIAVGDALQSFSQRSKAIYEGALHISQTLPKDELSTLRDHLQQDAQSLVHLYDEGRKILGYKAESLDALQKVMIVLSVPMAGFKRVVKSLQSLAVATRIEGSVQQENVIDLLADEMRILATGISEIIQSIERRIEHLERFIALSREKADALHDRRETISLDASMQMSGLFEAVDSHVDGGAHRSEFIAESSRCIAAAIEEIVFAVQIHDITRQKVEHVIAGLETVKGEIEKARVTRFPDSSSSIASSARLFRIQADQLSHADSQMSEAVGKISDSLIETGDSLRNILRVTRQTTGNKGHSVFVDMRDVLQSVAASLKSDTEMDAEVKGTLDALSKSLGDISDLLLELDRLIAQMKTVAVNAAIYSVNGLKNGGALDVISRAIQEQTIEAFELSRNLGSGVMQVMDIASRMNGTPSEPVVEQTASAEDLTVRFRQSLDRLMDTDTELTRLLEGLDEETATLANDIDRLSAQLRADKTFTHAIDEVCTTLSAITPASFNDSALESDEDNPIMKELFERYTMQSERDIHHGGHAHKSLVFNRIHPPKKGDEKIAASYVLGENIEIF